MMNALLITQDPDYAAIFELILKRAGLTVTIEVDLEIALRKWTDKPADLILSAVTRPPFVDQVRQIRAMTIVPLILVTDRFDEALHCDLLKAGADLTLATPFSPKLLRAQVEVLIRRAGNVPVQALPTLDVVGLSLDPANRMLKIDGRQPCRLTHLEFRLLYTLMINRGQTVSNDAIIAGVWGYGGQSESSLIRGLVNRVRAKVEVDRRHPRYIHTVLGIGYKFDDQENS